MSEDLIPKHLGLSLPTVSGDVGTSSACSPIVQEGQEDPDLNTIAETDLGSWDDDIDPEKIIEIMKGLRNKNRFFILCLRTLEDQEQRDVYRRLLLYRLRAHKLSKREFDKLDDKTLKKELPDFLGTASLFRLYIDVHYYLESLKEDEDGSVDWYFDPEFSMRKCLSDYQRLLLTNDGEYLHWKDYCSSFTTYKVDKDYVAFCDEMSEKLQWLKLFIRNIGSDEWEKMDTRGFNQAVMTATKFPEVTLDLVCTAYREHIWSLENDYRFREGWDSIFFAIWELVTEKKLEFTPAVIEVSKMHFVAARHVQLMLWDPESTWPDLKSKFESCVEGIPHYADNDFAEKWIAKAVLKLPKLKIMHQYKKRKMEIAENIGLAQGW